MICRPVKHGRVGVNISANHAHVLLQVEETRGEVGVDDWVQQARATLTVEQARALCVQLIKTITRCKEERKNP